MSDICEVLSTKHPDYDQMERTRAEFFEIAEAFDELDFQLLTKRVGNYPKVVPGHWMNGKWPAHVWAGISVVNQTEADRDIPKLLALPSPVRFLSVEPQLGPIDLNPWLLCECDHPRSAHAWSAVTVGCQFGDGSEANPICGCRNVTSREIPEIHWVIVGGESGSQARPFDTDWARSLIKQCSAAGVACFIKQMGQFYSKAMEFKDRHGGDWNEWPADLRVREFPRVGA